jgi:hypothetical protein
MEGRGGGEAQGVADPKIKQGGGPKKNNLKKWSRGGGEAQGVADPKKTVQCWFV